MKLRQLLLAVVLCGTSITSLMGMEKQPETTDADKKQFVQYILQDEGALSDIDILKTPTGWNIYSIFEDQQDLDFTNSDFENIRDYISSPFLKDLLFRLLHKEHELKKSGYTTYIHGQNRNYYWPEKLYTILWSIRNKQDVSNFLFAHIHDLRLTGRIKNILNPINYAYIGKKNLCMNGKLFSGPSAAQNATYYIADNCNHIPIRLTAKDAFEYLGYGHIFNQFCTEVQAIDAAYKSLCKHGNCLLVAVPESKKDQYITQHPAGCDEFFLPMTSQVGLNPASGIKIFPLITGDSAALEALKNRENKLFTAIKTVIEKPYAKL